MTQVDYDREMAFIAVREATGETVGVGRLVHEPDAARGRVRGGRAARHEGPRPGQPPDAAADRMGARAGAWRRSSGQVLADNAPMLAFVRKLGFSLGHVRDDPELVQAVLALDDASGNAAHANGHRG